jgi:hypothetical protein
MNEWKNEWMNDEWMKEWMNEWRTMVLQWDGNCPVQIDSISSDVPELESVATFLKKIRIQGTLELNSPYLSKKFIFDISAVFVARLAASTSSPPSRCLLTCSSSSIHQQMALSWYLLVQVILNRWHRSGILWKLTRALSSPLTLW